MAKTSKDMGKVLDGRKKPRTPAQIKQFEEMRKKAKKFSKNDGRATESAYRSAQVRREARTARETLLLLNEVPLSSTDYAILLEKCGLTPEDVRAQGIRQLDIPTLVQHAQAKQGNLASAVYVHDLVEGKIAEQHHVEVKDPSKMTLSELLELRRKIREESIQPDP